MGCFVLKKFIGIYVIRNAASASCSCRRRRGCRTEAKATRGLLHWAPLVLVTASLELARASVCGPATTCLSSSLYHNTHSAGHTPFAFQQDGESRSSKFITEY